MTAATASCFLHGYFDAQLTRCPKCATGALTARVEKAEAEAAAWKHHYECATRDWETERAECGRLREQLDAARIALARQMWLVDALDNGTCLDSDEAAVEWDNDELPSETYDEYAGRAALGVVGEADEE